ncbi:MAG: VCBS repeat-containing protein [Pyrinomonadaceae bacterium]|nr:VCBS repeat-containing protein [Pyrinomonadaceae bacterium]MBP6213470.1 VCBS repeat-containing protein [Pyrinomonadaceae bacterium]
MKVHGVRLAAAAFQVWVLVFSIAVTVPAQARPGRAVESPSAVFSNTQAITINTNTGLTAPTIASVYPSSISVSGMTGNITKVEVSIKGVTHTIGQIDLLLVSPTGAKFVFLSDSNAAIRADSFFTFSDSGATMLMQPNPVVSGGTYLPSDLNSGTDTFPAPAPAGPYNLPPAATFASVFNGATPNGTWQLFAVDDTLFTPGYIVSGWSMNITTDGAPQTFANPGYIGFNDIIAPATPYGSTIDVSGQTGVISKLKVMLTGFSHARPSDVDVLLTSPNGKSAVIMSDVPITQTANSIDLTFDSAATAYLNNSPMVSGSYLPFDFSSGESDLFQPPAPLPPHLTFTDSLDSFNGFSPNGEWRLFVVDDSQVNSGSIAGGWSIEITMVPTPPPAPLSCSGPSFSPTNFPTGTNPTNMAVADYNNDNKADLAVVNQASNDVSILLGNGNGTFGAQTTFAAGSGAYAIVAGKFNADNIFDLAVANSGSGNVSILLGNGNGTFAAATNFAAGVNPISIDSADFNGDGKVDLSVANFGGFFYGSVTILIGNGTGGFALGTPVRTRTQPSYVAATNFNGDGNQDLIIASFGANSVSTFAGIGNGTFQLNQNISTGAGPVAVETTNLNGDAFLDLAVANYNSDSVTICYGNSNGAFTGCSANNPAGGANPIALTSGDYTNTGVRTIASALSGSNAVGGFANPIAVGLFPNAIKTADFNGDGKPDMVTANSGSNDVSVLINSCLAAKGLLYDYNADRKTDYSVFRPSTTSYYIQSLNNSGPHLTFGRPNDTLVPADYDGDRRTDFAYYRPESGLWFILDFANRPLYFLQFGLPADIPTPADYDGDGKADLAVFRPSDGNWYIRRSTDNSLQVTHFGASGDKPVAADFDGDGKDDIAIFRPSTGVWYILRSSDGQATIRQFGISEDKTVVADYDGDGKADIAVWRPSTGVWYILRSSDGDFNAIAWGLSADTPVVGDFDGDGKFDLAIWRESDTTWYIRKSSDSGGLYYFWGAAGDKPLPNAYIR